MTAEVRFHPEAQLELDEAVAFYERERAGLGSKLLDEVDRAVRAAVEFPDRSPLILGHTRKLVLDRFPYSIMYFVRSDSLVISAVAHHRRRPYYWRDRS